MTIMKNMKKMTMGVVAGIALAGSLASSGVANAAPAKPALPVVAGAQSITVKEKARTAGEGLLTINALNNSNLLNNLNILNIGSFNKWINTSGSNCGCNSPS
jgi:hypothetical protein